jgi:hypothetical protein
LSRAAAHLGRQPDAALELPQAAAGDRPGQDPGQLGEQRVFQVGIPLGLRDLDRERDQPHAAPDAEIGPGDARLVVRGQPQLERRRELEGLGVQPARAR